MSDTENRTQAEAHKYPQIVQFVRETPWAILEPKLYEILQMVDLHARGHKFSDQEIQARIGSGPARRDAFTTAGSVAVIPIYGVITPRADVMTDISGGTSIDRLQQSLRAAVADEKVKSILLDVNSPGGSAAMLNEMAAEIRQARRVKPVVAVANTMAGSAAYYLAAQASEVVVTPSGTVGSIGTIAAHEDISKMQEMDGVKTTLVTAGKFKGELSPFGPLSDEAKAEIQRTVDKYYGMFVQDVARGRGVTVDTVRNDYGQGRMLLARDALAAGMVDRVDTFDNVLANMERNGAAGRNDTAAFAQYYLDNLAGTSASVTSTVYIDGMTLTAAVAEAADQELEPPGKPAADNEVSEAAFSGLSFADEADALRDSAEALVDRTRSLAEFRVDGRLTVTKRERLAACSEALRESLTAIDGVLAATQPIDHQAAFLAQRARYERSRFEGATT
jgi:capsid assembly protease